MNVSVSVRSTCVWVGPLTIVVSPGMRAITAAPGIRPKADTGDTESRHERCLVGMEVGPTGAQFGPSDPKDARYRSKFDGREIVRRCLSANCEYLVIWARDGDHADYNSKLLPKVPGLGQRDALRETVVDRGFGPPYRCWCEHCRREFRGTYGRATPKGATWDENWDRMLEFRDATSERFEKALYNQPNLVATEHLREKEEQAWLKRTNGV